jgi:hypothetical protein
VTSAPLPTQLDDLADLVATGPVDLGAYTQAEMAVVIGDVPALAGVQEEVLAEAVRSLAARGLLHRNPGESTVEIVGDLGLIVSLVASSVGAMDVRRGHPGPPDEPWRWLISAFANDIVGVDRIDALGLHRLALHATQDLTRTIAGRLIDGKARVPDPAGSPVPVTDAEVRRATQRAATRWQVIQRVLRPDGTRLVVDAVVVRTGESRVDLITRAPDSDGGYQRVAVDHPTLEAFLAGLFTLR